MPVEVGIWRINGAPERVHFSSIEKESKLEDVLYNDIGILDPSLMVVGRQVPTSFGKFIDLLAIDAQGDLTVVELKRDRTPREVGRAGFGLRLLGARSHVRARHGDLR
jgi:hypothetical protein